MIAPQQGREKQPPWLRTRPQAKFEENGNKPEENASDTII
jgi:hypothetical protein